jgi:hypothetical protein
MVTEMSIMSYKRTRSIILGTSNENLSALGNDKRRFIYEDSSNSKTTSGNTDDNDESSLNLDQPKPVDEEETAYKQDARLTSSKLYDNKSFEQRYRL